MLLESRQCGLQVEVKWSEEEESEYGNWRRRGRLGEAGSSKEGVMEVGHAKPADIVPPSPTASGELSSEPSPSVKGMGEASPDSAVTELKSRMKRQERKHLEALKKLDEQWRAQAERRAQEQSAAFEQVVKRAEEVVSQAQARARAKEASMAAEIKSLQEMLAGGPETPRNSDPHARGNPLFRRTSESPPEGGAVDASEGGGAKKEDEGGVKLEAQVPEHVPFSDVRERLNSAESRTLELAAKLADAESLAGVLRGKADEGERKAKVAEERVEGLHKELHLAGEKLQASEEKAKTLEKEATAAKGAQSKLVEVDKKLGVSEGKVKDLEAKLKKAEGDAKRAEAAEKKAKTADEKVGSLEKEKKSQEESLKAKDQKVAALEKDLAAVKAKLKDAEGKGKQLEGLKALEGKALALEKELAGAKEKAKVAEEKEKKLEGRVKALEGELASGKGKITAAEEKEKKLEGRVKSLEGEAREAKEVVKKAESEAAQTKTELKEAHQTLQSKNGTDAESLKSELKAAVEKVRVLEGKLSAAEKESAELRTQLAASEKGTANGSAPSELETVQQQVDAAKERNTALQKSLDDAHGSVEALKKELGAERERVKVMETRVKDGEGAGLRLKEAERQLAESKERAVKTTEEVTKLRQWSENIEASLEALQREKMEQETQLSEALRDSERLRVALTGERSALAAQRSQRESDVAILVRQVAGLQQQLQHAEDVRNQALRSAEEHEQREEHARREVDDLKQQVASLMSAKKSFREVTLEGEIAQLKGRAEDAAVWRSRLAEAERRLQDAEYREQKHLSALAAEEEKVARAQATIQALEQQREASEKGEGELEATIIDVTERVQAAEEQAAEAAKRAEELQDALQALDAQLAAKETQLTTKEASHKEASRALKKAIDEHARVASQLEEVTEKLRAATEAASGDHSEKPGNMSETSSASTVQSLKSANPSKGSPKLRKRSQQGKDKKTRAGAEIDDWELLALAQKENRKGEAHALQRVVLCGALSCASFAVGVAATCQLGMCSWMPL
ncbi:hypothetical protein KFL_002560010 [Klebsormidium nitens]|uniref:Uncharacterized protein n=1 Tax=Klebsormidium nitens TaxID=105231 RepID=A0A0U9HK41_KLENI|nr:hypothetical protein KFL_002560010 [Klebsormidium nitens]|eukprot:GAQ85815.1 hypothetical protein KFL_002560010 [Klebsormidium nitens]